MKLALVAVGSLKERFYREACAEYGKRMNLMRPVEITEIREEFIADENVPALVEKALEQEGRRILQQLRADDAAIALTPAGEAMDSAAFAKMIDPAANPECRRSVFIIGSSHGLSPVVYEKCRRTLSFGPMTFPHQLARVMLLEQLYRGQMMRSGRAYHK